MNPIQKESDLSKSEMLYSFKQIRLKRFGHFPAKKTNLYPTYYTFLYDMQKRHGSLTPLFTIDLKHSA